MTISINGIIQGVPSKEDHGGGVQDIAELQTVGPSERFDRQERYVEDELRPYYFDIDSVSAESLPDIVEPDDSPAVGRWIRLPQMMGAPALHAASHTNGVDQIAAVTGAVNGLMTAADKTKLNGIGALANVTSVFGRTGVVVAVANDYAHAQLSAIGVNDHHNKLHAADHVSGVDTIQSATGAQKGLATAAQITKLNAIEALADVTGSNPPQAHSHVKADLPARTVYGDQANTFDNLHKQSFEGEVDFDNTIKLKDIGGAPVADRLIRLENGLIRFMTTLQSEGKFLSRNSVENFTNDNIAGGAAIVESKLNLNNPTHAKLHAVDHVNGTDDIQNATAGQKGLATAAQITKLDGIEALADVTDTATITAAGALLKNGTIPLDSTWDVGNQDITGIKLLLAQDQNTNDIGAPAMTWNRIYVGHIAISTGFTHLTFSSGETLFNIAGSDMDVRVRGDNDEQLLTIDAGLDRVGVGVALGTHTAKFQVNGDIRADGIKITQTSGSEPINNTTGLDSRKLAFESRLWDGAAPQTRSGFIRTEDVSGTDDELRFVLSSDHGGGAEFDFGYLIHDTVSGHFALQPGVGEQIELRNANGVIVLNASTSVVQLKGTNWQAFSKFIHMDDAAAAWGSGNDFELKYNTTQSNNGLTWGFQGSEGNYLLITNKSLLGSDFLIATQSNPTMIFHDGVTADTDYSRLFQTGVNFFIDNAVGNIVTRSVAAGVTADPGSAQGDGPITTDIVQISVSVNVGNAVTLPPIAAGMTLDIVNDGTKSVDVFPASGANIDGVGVNTAVALASGASVRYYAYDATNWQS